MGEEEADLDPWNGQGVRLKAFEEDKTATTVSYAKARLENEAEEAPASPEEAPQSPAEPRDAKLDEMTETDAFCGQLRRSLERVRAYECEIVVAEQRDDVDGPLEPRRRRRTRALRRRSASPASSTSSSGDSVDERAERPVRRTQHELSHARAERLQRQRTRPSKVDAALAKRQRSLNRVATAKPAVDSGVSAQTLEAHVRQRAFSLDGQAGCASLPVQRRSSNGEFLVRRYNAYLTDETELQAPAVSWNTLRMAREKCTEWLVKHVLLPDAIPRLRNPKPRIA